MAVKRKRFSKAVEEKERVGYLQRVCQIFMRETNGTDVSRDMERALSCPSAF
jgi:hypothetical protein